MRKCTICGRVLKNPDSLGHINSKFHQDALKKKDLPREKSELEPIKLPPKLDKKAKIPILQKLEIPPLQIQIQKKKPKLKSTLELKVEPKESQKPQEENALEYASEEDMDLGIPIITEPPKRKEKLSVNSDTVSSTIIEKIKQLDSNHVKVVLVNCRRCNNVIAIPVPRELVLDSDLPVVPVSYIHFNGANEDLHCTTIHLDRDFDIRRQRNSSVIMEEKIIGEKVE